MPATYKPTSILYLELTHERVREIIDYDPETGIFRWKVNRGPKKAGTIAGAINGSGYLVIAIENSSIRANRLAWFWMTGRWPSLEIDHKNQVKSDDRWTNLREATVSQNSANRKTKKRDLPRGVFRQGSSYCAKIRRNGANIYRHGFSSPEEAQKEYLRLFSEIHGAEFYPTQPFSETEER